MKKISTAYIFWALSVFGILGFHRFYLRKYGTGIIWFISGGVFGFGAFVDLFTLGMQVEQYNSKRLTAGFVESRKTQSAPVMTYQ